MSTTIYLVENPGPVQRRAFRSQTDAWKAARDTILDLFDTTGLSEWDMGIDFTRLSNNVSLPADWLELSCQWNDYWCDEPEMQVLIYEIPLD